MEESSMSRSERVLYAGTADGLYLIEEEDGEFDARPIGFQGMGGMRAPVVQDVDDPRRLYAGTTKAGFFISEDGGETWKERAQGIVYKNVGAIVTPRVTGTYVMGPRTAH